MHAQTLPSPGSDDRLGTVLTGGVSDPGSAVVLTLACVLLFLLLNPFLALFVLAVVGFFRPVPVIPVLVFGSLSFALFFYFREYGVEWYLNSSDDVPTYITLYESGYVSSFSDLFVNFASAPNGNEFLWYLPWWLLIRVFDASDDTFVFLHYLTIFACLFIAFATLSKRHFVAFALVYFFLTPVSLDGAAHIWRQQLALSMFVTGAGLYLVRGRSIGKWLMWATPLVHFAFLFFTIILFVFLLMRRYRTFDNKLKLTLILLAAMAVMPLLARQAVFFLDSIGLARIMSYFEGYDTDVTRVYLLMTLYTVPMLAAFYLLRNDPLNQLFMLLSFTIFSIALAMPGANTIYERLLMSILPLWGLFLFRCMLENFSFRWYLPFIVVVFVTGAMRIHAPLADGEGVATVLAYGHAFDPFMGAVKMLTSL
jgi:hypothetical protein